MKTDITIYEADILRCLKHEKYITQRILAEASGYSIGVVNKSVKALSEKGLLDNNMRLTQTAHKLFASNKPQNAIILAAGFGMRMVPINWTTPKALLEINGERLIERLIHQLNEAGVTDITVVVGFMKENFEYLIDLYGVDLVVNEEYKVKNNLTSLNKVRGRLGNTYIVPSDIWCINNPFSEDELYSWYMVSDSMDLTSDVRINRKQELVKVSRNESGNAMIGITYLTEDISNIVKSKLEAYASDPGYDNRFWEESLYSNDRMLILAKLVSSDEVAEINTYEQLREIDSNSNHLKSEALDVISATLHCESSDVVNIQVLKKGMTNRSFLFIVKDSKYIMRIPGEGSDMLVNRQQEAAVYKAIAGLELCDDPVYINPANGYKITKYIDDIRCCDPGDEADIRACMRKLKRFHSLKLNVPHSFDLFNKIKYYESLWDGQSSIYADHEQTTRNILSLQQFVLQERGPLQLTHIDAVPDNFLFDPNTEGELNLQLTDWEYAGMEDPHLDIAMFAVYSLYSKAETDHLIDIYFEDDGGCSKRTRAKLYCYIAACGLLWSNWCEYKSNLGVEFGEYSLRQYRFAKDYYKYASALIHELDVQINDD